MVEQALRAALTQSAPAQEYRLHWAPVRGGAQPALDIADRDALYEVMEHAR